MSHSPGDVNKLALKPPKGSQPSHTANTMISSMPNQKCGMATPEMAKVVTAMSVGELRFIAEIVPSEMPSGDPEDPGGKAQLHGELQALDDLRKHLHAGQVGFPPVPAHTPPIQPHTAR